MEEKKEVSVKNTKSTTLVIVMLIIVILGLAGLVFYQNKLLDKEREKVNSNKTDNTSSEVEQKRFSEEELNNYLKMVPYLQEYNSDAGYEEMYDYDEDAYTGKLVTANDLNEKLLLAQAYRHAERTDTKEEINHPACGDNKCSAFIYVKEETFKKTVKDMYNIDTIKVDGFNTGEGYVKLSKGYYAAIMTRGSMPIHKYNKLIKYEVKDNDLVIYEKVLFTASISAVTYVLKTTNSDLSTSLIQPTLGNFDEAEKYALNNIDSGNTYKHTFKVNNEGNYYWYSSELVNS